MQVGEENGVDGVQPHVTLEGGERSGAKVHQETEALGFHKVRRAGRLRAGETAGASQDGQSHLAIPFSPAAGDSPPPTISKIVSGESATVRSLRRDK
ncbi:hypothetical protein GCM10027280_27170 [Micromonospora polyrhachis]